MTAQTGQQPLLNVRGLNVRYGADPGTSAVHEVSFTLSPGERVAVVGESGSGKTTLGLALAGFLRTAEGGQVEADLLEFDGAPLPRGGPAHWLPRRIPGIAMVFQDAMTSLDPVWTIGSQMLAVLRADRRISRRQALRQARERLEQVGLGDVERVLAARPDELSGGMRQRVMIALALAGSPRLLIADEPTSALDAVLARSTMELLLDLSQREGTAVLIISHDIELCLTYADRLFVMYHGELVEQIASARAATDCRHPYSIGLLRCVPTLETVDAEHLPTLEETMRAATGDALREPVR